SAPGPEFSYVPSVTKLTPISGPAAGGTSVVIEGTGFQEGHTTVKFGSAEIKPGEVEFKSSTSIKVSSPAGTGKVPVAVTTEGGPSAPGRDFSALPLPGVTGLSPNTGPESGGTEVTITGGELEGATEVHFGESAAASKADSSTSMRVIAPPGSGSVHVTVTTTGGTSEPTGLNVYTY